MNRHKYQSDEFFNISLTFSVFNLLLEEEEAYEKEGSIVLVSHPADMFL